MSPSAEASLQEVGRLGALPLDALRELANLGAGQAVTALAQITGWPVRLDVPTVSVGRLAITEVVGSGVRPLLIVRSLTGRPLEADLLLALAEADAWALTDLVLDRATSRTGRLDSIGASTIREVGKVLGHAYVDALARVIGWTIPMSAPELLHTPADHAQELLHPERRLGDHTDWGLCLETTFHVEAPGRTVCGHLLLFPDQPSVQALLAAMGVA